METGLYWWLPGDRQKGGYCLLSDKQAERSHLCLVCHTQKIGLDMEGLEGEI